MIECRFVCCDESKNEFMGLRVSDLYVNPEERKIFSDKMLQKEFVRNAEYPNDHTKVASLRPNPRLTAGDGSRRQWLLYPANGGAGTGVAWLSIRGRANRRNLAT